MKKYILVLFVMVAGLAACSKKEAPFDAAVQAAADDAQIKAYLKSNNLTATKDSAGFYYTVVTPGTGAFPTANSNVTVNYEGKFLSSGAQFDKNNGISFDMGRVIRGWTLGLQKINVGGRIILYIPSGLGYGNTDNGRIPPNSVLMFTVDLLSMR
ncbi:FKBP-type peptidyl-prolyl cis-trans isomerase [Mucilaginibacter myungsuensis]|uniref:Peptidyl-prolyl cis-trans isomerase n=1 Tax=Mucilaginibacter myungsuensis TaxID=649104 RepID=A0A929KVF1_9SPHI|nr:FKBP-type peptidyl-prolyl cis-trans isomerase [Mucilaginibacter myungsuensis]MBE9661153.1 FKBP-type peptidyl-prolyl cis-trans isomerase [Mucilaginibacter myungsuensis]MDN3597298.1 FKBP-type peptidyl-prolyl cis-trans isomerase [Mucilaginibacter myungsuensis]